MRDLVLGLYARLGALGRFLGKDDGQDMVEYAIVLGLIAMGAVAAMKGLATSIGTGLAGIGAKLTAYTS